MKIDIHVHTRKTKQGDAQTREIDARRFHEIISSTDVKIVAITNHNYFDFAQYTDFTKAVGDDFKIWPGVEIDVVEDGRRGHLLVIVSPNHAELMGRIMDSLSQGTSPNDFYISIDEIISNFDGLSPLYIAHYKKKPELIDSDIKKLVSETDKNRVLREATNAISAGIFLSHGHTSIYGSDVQDWDRYEALSKDLPDLRLPVESFEQFCMLLNKDQSAINSLLDRKAPEKISIKPFEDNKPFEITVYNDINVFFGSKGTGKSKILEAIARYYATKGISANKYESSSATLEHVYDLSCKKSNIDLLDYGIEYCGKEIDLIRKAQETDITSLSKYVQHFSAKMTNVNAKKIKVKDFSTVDIQINNREFTSVDSVHKKFKEFKEYLENDKSVTMFIEPNKLKKLLEDVTSLIEALQAKRLSTFVELKVVLLFNNLIKKVKSEVSKKTGIPEKPSATGFREYASNRIKIEIAVKTILKNIQKEIRTNPEYVGSLDEKGDLYCNTEIQIQDGSIRDGKLRPYKSVNKSTQTGFSKAIQLIDANLYSPHLFEKIAELNAIDGIDTIPTIIELLMIGRHFTINDKVYIPSSGEASMLLLHKELNVDKDVYILDEPEKSLGNEYINNVIVPLIKEKAKIGKKIFIATHDANIAVRTLPYNSVYRKHGLDGYDTFVGNPFSNDLVNIKNADNKIDWKEISMRTLEGGKNAFGERRRIYGNP